MTEEESVAKLSACVSGDQELAHACADEILLEFLDSNGFKTVADAWRSADERCGGFWYV